MQIIGRFDALIQTNARFKLRLELAVLIDIVMAERLLDHEQVEGIQLLQMRRVGNSPTEFRVVTKPIEDGEYASGPGWLSREQMLRIVDRDEEADDAG